MERYHYIIIDDEIQSQLKLNHYFKSYKNYKCKAVFSNPELALQYLQENEVDLIFLDIEMQEMNGFQFLEALQKDILVVIFTAFENKYSVEAHHYYDKELVFFSNKAQISYYLPKIIARFEKMFIEKKIVNRVKLISKNEILTFPQKINNKTIFLEDIVYIEVIGHHTILKIKNQEEEIIRTPMRDLLDFLPAHIFFQIRRNMIINVRHLTAFTDSTVCVEGQHYIISKRNRKTIVPALLTQKQELLKNY